ncbi:hypothetical protein DU443_12845 [Escherichia coli]|nr:hypothetical protein [Escherichia coli]
MLFNNLDIHNSNNLRITAQCSPYLFYRWGRYIVIIAFKFKVRITFQAFRNMELIMLTNFNRLKYCYYTMLIAIGTGIVKTCVFFVEAVPESIDKMPKTSFVYRIAFKFSITLVNFMTFLLKQEYFLVLKRERFR